MKGRVLSFVAVAYLTACIVLGGASAAGVIANGVLQALAVVIILGLLWSGRAKIPPVGRPLVWIVALLTGFSVLSLIPLPMTVWEALAPRAEIATELRLLGISDAWLPLSLSPSATLASLLWLLPPVAVALLAMQVPTDQRGLLAGTVTVLAMLSILLGVFQLMGGETSPYRFYEITNRGSPVGFFANINHQATLLLAALPCSAFVASKLATSSDRSKRTGGLIVMGSSVIFFAAGIAVAGSMAGYGLFIPAAFASFLIYRRATAKQLGLGWQIGLALMLLLFVAGTLAGPFSQQSLSNKFDDTPTSRRVIALTTSQAIGDSFPAGTGLGTFANVYRRYQDPQQASREYVNHAHNDYLEVALELGAVGILLVLIFLFWFMRRSFAIWRTDVPGALLGRAGSVIIGIVLLHSLVDYPLRTSAIAAVFAAACAFMLPPKSSRVRRSESEDSSEASSGPRHLEA